MLSNIEILYTSLDFILRHNISEHYTSLYYTTLYTTLNYKIGVIVNARQYLPHSQLQYTLHNPHSIFNTQHSTLNGPCTADFRGRYLGQLYCLLLLN